MPGSAPIRARFSASAATLALLAVAQGVALTCAAAGPQQTGLVPYAIVGDSIPTSLTGAKGDPARGRAIVADRQVGLCLLCHSAPFPDDKFQGNIGPDLAGVGGRLSEGELRLRIVDTSKIDPDTIMPPFYRVEGLNRVPQAYHGKPVLTAVEIEDVVAYLMTLK
jgi:L-cysteine S-thiosulfotransferase